MRASFRDPLGRVLKIGDRIIRVVNPDGFRQLTDFLSTDLAMRLAERGTVSETRFIEDPMIETEIWDHLKPECEGAGSSGHAVFEHGAVAFPSFPYEWAPEMLHSAAELTLDLAEESLSDGFGLKDATPYNILFRGAKPVFVDLLSFERRHSHDPIWLAYAQFVRTFLLPLLTNVRFKLPIHQTLLANRDGLEPESVYAIGGAFDKLKPPFLSLVSFPTLLGGVGNNENIYVEKRLASEEKARFVLKSLFKRLRRQLKYLRPSGKETSRWSEYSSINEHKTFEYTFKKCSFVKQVVAAHRPRRVLDIGCNTGEFSEIAADHDAEVVAIDSDPTVIGRLWRKASRTNANILPLVVDIARPSPGVGWQNAENDSFIERAAGRFELVMMLGVVHHLVVTERIPLDEVLALAFDLTSRDVIIEFIAPEDEMFRTIARGRDELYRDLTCAAFERSCLQRFKIVSTCETPRPDRTLYHLRKQVYG